MVEELLTGEASQVPEAIAVMDAGGPADEAMLPADAEEMADVPGPPPGGGVAVVHQVVAEPRVAAVVLRAPLAMAVDAADSLPIHVRPAGVREEVAGPARLLSGST